MKRRSLFLGAAFLAALGLALTGQGLWIVAKAAVAQVLLERAFGETIETGQPVKPWTWADTWPVARLSVPRIGATAIVLASGSGQSLAFGPGHLAGTPAPGQSGTTVYAAHRDTHFAFLAEMRVSDLITVTDSAGLTYTYRMTGSEIVRWDESRIDARAPGRHLVLATCWPLDARMRGPLRYLVHAELAG